MKGNAVFSYGNSFFLMLCCTIIKSIFTDYFAVIAVRCSTAAQCPRARALRKRGHASLFGVDERISATCLS